MQKETVFQPSLFLSPERLKKLIKSIVFLYFQLEKL